MYEKICPQCRTRLSEFMRTGMLGCPECYKAFEKELTAVIYDMQGSTFHLGKSPRIVGVDKELIDEYNRLEREREKAGIDGNFSLMATLSEELIELRDALKKRGLM